MTSPEIPGAFDFSFEPLETRAEVHEFCSFESDLENAFVAEVLRDLVPRLLAEVFDVATRASTAELGLPTQFCTCRFQCEGDPVRGPQSQCVHPPGSIGNCDVAIELDRVFLTPEGIQLVFSENDADPQASVMTAMEGVVVQHLADFFQQPVGGLEAFGISFSCDPQRRPVNLQPEAVHADGRRIVDPTAL